MARMFCGRKSFRRRPGNAQAWIIPPGFKEESTEIGKETHPLGSGMAMSLEKITTMSGDQYRETIRTDFLRSPGREKART
jgi:hypothetical protein